MSRPQISPVKRLIAEKMKIQEARPDDELWMHVENLFPRAIGWLNDPDDTGEYRFFIATDDDHALLGGSIIEIGKLRFGPLADIKTGFLEDITILEPHRRKGIGKALLHATLNAAWMAGCESVRATVSYDAAAAIALYRNTGFGFIPEEDPDAKQPDRIYSIVAINPNRLTNT